MKHIKNIILTLLIGSLYLLAVIITAIRLLFTLTIQFAWEISDEWHWAVLGKLLGKPKESQKQKP